ncbi:MAG: glucose-1-phosphate cytidylyltransferase [bacterium]|nr:glucose-1-phosphate cytidylyltransferase [bacterium]
MKVVILCGGKGERLREETEFKPKPLIEIGEMPILWHIMKIYSHYGHKEFIILLGYKGYMIKEFFLNFEYRVNDYTLNLRDREDRICFHKKENLEDWKITFVDTGLDTHTGGRISRIRDLIKEDDFFLTYGDGLSNVDINKLSDYHKKKNKTLTLIGVNPASQYGIIEVEDGLARSFKEKPRLDGVINGGFFVCNRKIFRYLRDDAECVFEDEPMKKLAREGELAVYLHQGFWTGMDTYKQVQGLNKIWNSENIPWKVW